MERVIVDICGTLYKSNTTFDFLDRISYENKKYKFWRKVSRCFFLRKLNSLLFVLLQKDFKRIYFLTYLKGYSKDLLLLYAQDFFCNYLKQRENKEVIDYLLSTPNWSLVLASATIDPIASIIAKSLNISNYISSDMEYDNYGVCTGKLKKDLLGKKKDALLEKGFGETYEATISDDYWDLPLFKSSKFTIVVSSKKRISFWQQVAAENELTNVRFICVD